MMVYGFISDWLMDKLIVWGLFEVILCYCEIKGIQELLCDKLLVDWLDVFVGVDYFGFNLGLEEQFKKVGILIIYFIGLQIWVWCGWCIKKIQCVVLYMLVIFFFEENLYWQVGVLVIYVGYLLVEVILL